MVRMQRSPGTFNSMMRMMQMSVVLASGVIALTASPATAAEFPVSTTQVAEQRWPAAAVDSSGRGLVVWENPHLGLLARVVGVDGASGPELRVADNVNLANLPGEGEILAHRHPAIVADGAGGFVAFWTAERAYLRATYFMEHRRVLGQDVYGRRLDATGRPVGAAFRVDDGSAAFQSAPVALRFNVDGQSRIAVVWESDDRVAGSNDLDGLQGRIYGASAAPLGGQFRVSRASGGSSAHSPALVADRAGNLFVAWHSWGDGAGVGVFARRFTGAGVALGPQVLVNTRTAGDQGRVAVAFRPAQGYLVVWQGWTGERLRTKIYGQRFDGAGARVGGEFEVSDGSGEYDASPSLAATPSGFLVTWIKWDRTFPLAVLSRNLDRQGVPAAAVIRVNAKKLDAQHRTQLVVGPQGILSVWLGYFNPSRSGIAGTWIQP